MRWTVLIPVRSVGPAKTRLAPASPDAAAHDRLVAAIRADTIAAALATPDVARVVRVLDGPDAVEDGTLTHVQQAPGLNAALAEAGVMAAARWPEDGVAALVGDLPALRPAELQAALTRASAYATTFVPDAEGTGTTLLTALPGVALSPGFGMGSAARHGDRALPLHAGPGLRRDVDTAADLAEAVRLRVGPATAAVVSGGADSAPHASAC
jgi:2-phospho-L-lactate guanylyltransferase